MNKLVAAALLTGLVACRPDKLDNDIADLDVNDVLVVRFVPEGSTAEQFYFYKVFKLGGDTVYTHPARQPVPTTHGSVGPFASEATRAFTRQELRDFQKESPSDPQHSQLVDIGFAKPYSTSSDK